MTEYLPCCRVAVQSWLVKRKLATVACFTSPVLCYSLTIVCTISRDPAPLPQPLLCDVDASCIPTQGTRWTHRQRPSLERKMKTETPRPIHLADYRPPKFLIEKVDLQVSLHSKETRVRNRMTVRRNPDSDQAAKVLRLDGVQLAVGTIKINRKSVASSDYQVTKEALTLSRLPTGRNPFTVEIETVINPEANTALQGLYRSRGVYCTQCEAQGFRHMTYFLDRPDVLSRYTVRIDADPDEAPVLLSNGNLVERGTLGRDGRHYAVWKDPHPKPCYLFALVGGDLSSIASTFETMEGRKVDLRIYVEHGKEARAGWALDSLKRAMRWDEEKFGRAYDLDVFNIVAVSDFNLGAMENKGLNIFNDRLILASPETATDASFAAIESVVAHEYFHNWTGNRITCRDWFQLCLKEGLTVFRDQEFSADMRSRVVQRIADVRRLKAYQFAEDTGPLAHPVRPKSYIEINNFYTTTVYEKGAELVRMIATLLGQQGFQAGMDLYFDRHDGEAATIEDFITCFEDASGEDLSHFMRWYQQAGTPELICQSRFDKSKQRLDLEIEQITPRTADNSRKLPLHIPLKFGLLDRGGNEIDLQLAQGSMASGGVLQLTKRRHKFRFLNVKSRPVASMLRDFSAPVKLTMNVSDRDLAFLMQNDPDLYNRWQAANQFATRTLIKMVKTRGKGKQTSLAHAYADALKPALLDSTLEAAYRAELLHLPSQTDIAREIGKNVNPTAIATAHRTLSKLIARRLGDALEAIYDGTKTPKTFSPDAESAGRRALRNAALTLLIKRGTERDQKRLVKHSKSANNMTDEAHALFLLAANRGKASEQALNRFHKKWKDDHVVIDLWFAAQAQSPRAGTLQVVKALTRHPLYSPTAPNKVRALIGNFVMQNPVQFNRPDGKGYKFAADQVIALDRVNPQIAARLLSCFKSWQALEPKRRKFAAKALSHVASTKNISRDVYEIAHKILDP